MKAKRTPNRVVDYMILLVSTLLVMSTAAAEENPADAAEPQGAETEVQANSTAPDMQSAAAKPGFNSKGSKMLSLSYGYVMTDYEDVNSDADGWRVNFTYEMNPTGGKLLHGTTIGYMETSAESSGGPAAEYEVKSIPIYYAPKLMLGKKAIKVFAKGALGCHFSDYTRSGISSSSFDEFGFYGGGSLGAMVVLKDKLFVNAEYEWIYMSNSYFQDGAVESAMIGIGLKL